MSSGRLAHSAALNQIKSAISDGAVVQECHIILYLYLQSASHNIDCSEGLSAQKPWETRNTLRKQEDVEEISEMSLACSRRGRSFQVIGSVTAKAWR